VIIFQAIILTAGIGKRLRPFTEALPKSLIKLHNTTILDRQIEILFRNGIKEIILVTGYKSDLIKNHLQKKNKKNVKIIFNEKFDQFETLYSLWLAKKYINSDFILLYGDLIFDETIISLFLKQNFLSGLVVDSTPNYDNHSVVVQNSLIKDIDLDFNKENPSAQFIGICKFSGFDVNQFKKVFDDFVSKNNFEGEYVQLIKFLIQQNFSLFAFFTEKLRWINVNDENKLKLAIQFF